MLSLPNSKPSKPEPNPTSKRLHFDQPKRKRGSVKHGILKTCLDGWLPCVSSHFCGERGKLLVYVDGFAGAGKHVSSNENGSPLLMCDTVAVHHKLKKNFWQPNKPLVGLLMVFTEKDQKTWEKLKKNVDERLGHHNKGGKVEFIYKYRSETFPGKLEEVHAMFRGWRDSPEYQHSQCPKIYVVVECGEFNDKMNQVLDVYANNPMFIFADPFGWTGMPLDLFHRILSNCTPWAPKDMLINFMDGNIRRFIDHEGHQDSLRETIGEIRPPPTGPGLGTGPGSSSGSGLHNSGLSPQEKLEHIICEYIRNIKQGYRRDNLMDVKFAMRGKNNGHVYHLIFLCSHIKSLKHMKYSMYRYSDTCKDFKFSEWNKKLQFRDFPQEKKNAAREVFERVKEHFDGEIVSGEKIDDYICTHIPLHFNFKVELKKLLHTCNFDQSAGENSAFNKNVYNFNVYKGAESVSQEIIVAQTVPINHVSGPMPKDDNENTENSRNYASTRMDALTAIQRQPSNRKQLADTLRDADEVDPAQVRVAMKRRNF